MLVIYLICDGLLSKKNNHNQKTIYIISNILKQYSENNSPNNYTFRDFSSSINLKNAIGNSPMHIVAKRGNLEFIKLLKIYGGNINLQNNNGDTPFIIMKRFDIDISC